MAFKNPWGKGSKSHDRWFENKWGNELPTLLEPESNVTNDDVLKVELTVTPDPSWLIYEVKAGESFISISTKFGTSGGADDLAYWNNMDVSDPSQPHVGDKLSLPYITDEYLDEVEAQLDEITQWATDMNWDVAVDNLNRFRAGTGGVKILDVEWVKGFEEVQDCIKTIQEYFEDDCFSVYANDLDDGESIEGDGSGKVKGNLFWWETVTDPSYVLSRNELSYACGSSTVTGIGKISLKKKDYILSVDGTVEFEFYDKYDWNPGDSAPVYSGNPLWPISYIEDSDMLLLEEYRGAKQFEMKATWKQSVRGKVDDDIFSPNDINVKWTDI